MRLRFGMKYLDSFSGTSRDESAAAYFMSDIKLYAIAAGR